MSTNVTHKAASRSIDVSRIRDMVMVAGFVLALGASSQWQILLPNSPVPMTMQTVVVLLCGFWLRPRLAVAAVCGYLALGFATAGGFSKMPFFAAYRSGISTMTLGYLVGFLPAACLVSLLIRSFRRVTFARIVVVGAFGTAVILASGLVWMALTITTIDRAIAIGLVPFAVPAMFKLMLVSVLVYAGRWTTDT